MFDTLLPRWHFVPDGEPIVTNSPPVLPVMRHGMKLMLKVSDKEDERTGGLLMSVTRRGAIA